jgi:hypothetical protein
MAKLPLGLVFCTIVCMQSGCNAHAFGGSADLYMLNECPLDGQGRMVSHNAHLTWDFVKIRKQHSWTRGDLSVDVLQAVADFEAASPSVGSDPTAITKTAQSFERRTIVCTDPLVAVCVAEDRVVAASSELNGTSVAFFRYGIARLTLPMGYEAGTTVDVPGSATWLVLENGNANRFPARDQDGNLQPLLLQKLKLSLKPSGGHSFKVTGEPIQSGAILVGDPAHRQLRQLHLEPRPEAR